MKAKEFAASAAKFNALESLARTDDMLAIIGVIMLAGVIVTSYGAYWQGKVAHAQYKNDCGCSKDPAAQQVDKYKNYKIAGIIILFLGFIAAICIYISRKQKTEAVAS